MGEKRIMMSITKKRYSDIQAYVKIVPPDLVFCVFVTYSLSYAADCEFAC